MKKLACYYAVGAAIRFWFLFSEYNDSVINRIELATPLNTWKRVKEGVTLYHEGISPYDGDLFHRTPIELVIFTWLIYSVPPFAVNLLFIICDMVTSFILYKTASLYMRELFQKQEREKSKYVTDTKNSLLKEEDILIAPVYVFSAYLFNPYIILNCAAKTTTVFSNLLLSLVLLSMIKGKLLLSCSLLAVCTLRSFYPWVLLVPIGIYAYKSGRNKLSSAILLPVCFFGISLLFLLQICYQIMKDWNFIENTILFILNVPDLKPNMGLFWYFFTEMFEHFRPLFLWSFQINATVLYLIPLSIRFKEDPMLLSFSLITLIAIFKSYPSVGDIGFYLSLIPMWKHLFEFMAQGFTVLCVTVCCSVFAPTVWHLWIYSGSANANFYFGVTLAFATAQIFLITDILFAYTKREFNLRYGSPKTTDIKVFLS